LNVNIFSVGVGCGYNLGQLKSMATDPDDTHVFLLKSFSVINLLLKQMTAVACVEAALLTPGNSTRSTIGACEIKYFRPQCGALSNEVVVRVQDLSGSTSVYVSTSDSSPGPYSYTQSNAVSTIKSFAVSQVADNVQPVYIGILGVANTSEFLIDVYNGLCFVCN
jgi:hypothetical protein